MLVAFSAHRLEGLPGGVSDDAGSQISAASKLEVRSVRSQASMLSWNSVVTRLSFLSKLRQIES